MSLFQPHAGEDPLFGGQCQLSGNKNQQSQKQNYESDGRLLVDSYCGKVLLTKSMNLGSVVSTIGGSERDLDARLGKARLVFQKDG